MIVYLHFHSIVFSDGPMAKGLLTDLKTIVILLTDVLPMGLTRSLVILLNRLANLSARGV